MNVNIQRALTIDGWMGDCELEWLADQAQRCQRIVEVGAWMGRTTVALAENTNGTMYAVDTWEGSEEHQEELKGKPEDWLFEQFRANTRHLRNVIPCQGSSTYWACYFGHVLEMNWKVDMIFLDAAHDYANVKADILAWRPLLAPQGLLCGHDIRPAFPGVRQAVEELVPGWRKVEGNRNSIWYAPRAA